MGGTLFLPICEAGRNSGGTLFICYSNCYFIELYGTIAGKRGVLNLAVPQVQKQSGKTDRGCFAIAWAVHLTYGAVA